MWGHRQEECWASLRVFRRFLLFFSFLPNMSLKFLFIYEHFLKTDGTEFTLLSLDAAAAGRSCADVVCVCKHGSFHNTPHTHYKGPADAVYWQQLVVLFCVARPVNGPNTIRLRPRRAQSLICTNMLPRCDAATMSMTTITEAGVKSTTAICLCLWHAQHTYTATHALLFLRSLLRIWTRVFLSVPCFSRKLLEEAPLLTKALREAQMKEKMERYPKVSNVQTFLWSTWLCKSIHTLELCLLATTNWDLFYLDVL